MLVRILRVPALAGYARFGHIHAAQIVTSIAIAAVI